MTHIVGDFCFVINKGQLIKVKRIHGDSVFLTIPDTVGSENITSIGENAFSEIKKPCLTQIILPNSVKNVKKCAFSNLKVKTVVWSSQCHTIPEQCFLNSRRLRKLKNINHVQSIEKQAFMNCISISKFNYPSNCNTIPQECFSGCKKLESVTNTSHVARIQAKAFYLTDLKNIYLSSHCKDIGDYAFSRSGLLDFVWPESCTIIRSGMFEKCKKLKSITLNNNIKSIYNSAFSGCILLDNVIWPEKVDIIPSDCFINCLSLSNIIFGGEIKEIMSCAFKHTSIKEISFLPSLETIHAEAFAESSLSAIYGIEEVSLIAEKAFFKSNITSIIWPPKCKKISDKCFSKCYFLDSVFIPIQYNEIEIEENAFLETNATILYLPT